MPAFKEQLASGRPLVGLWVSLTDPAAVEIALSSGFDWILQDGEHSPAEPSTFMRTLQIAAGYATDVLVRPAYGDAVTIKRLLDVGARNLLIPMVDTTEHAALLAAAMEFPPKGIRGVSSQTRGGSWGRRADYLATARDELVLIVQIESVEGIQNAEAIIGTPGVDAVFVGTADLAASLGFPGEPSHAAVAEAIERVVALAQRASKPVGTLTRDLEAARRYAAQGFTFVGVGTDSHLFAQSLAELRQDADLS